MSLFKPIPSSLNANSLSSEICEEELSDSQDLWIDTENILSNPSSSDDSNCHINHRTQLDCLIKVISSSSTGSSNHSQSPFVYIPMDKTSADRTLERSSSYWNFPNQKSSECNDKLLRFDRVVHLDHYERLSPSFLTLNYLSPIIFSLTPGQRRRLHDLTSSMLPILRLDRQSDFRLEESRFPDIPSILNNQKS